VVFCLRLFEKLACSSLEDIFFLVTLGEYRILSLGLSKLIKNGRGIQRLESVS